MAFDEKDTGNPTVLVLLPLFFSCLLIHFVVPSHPIHFFYDAQLMALTPAQGHSGFDKWLGRFYDGVGPYRTKDR